MATQQSLSERKLMFLEVSERKIKTSAFFGLKCTLDSTLNCGTLQILRIMEHGLILCLRTMLTIQCCLKSIEISVENKLNEIFIKLRKVPLHSMDPRNTQCAFVRQSKKSLAPTGTKRCVDPYVHLWTDLQVETITCPDPEMTLILFDCST